MARVWLRAAFIARETRLCGRKETGTQAQNGQAKNKGRAPRRFSKWRVDRRRRPELYTAHRRRRRCVAANEPRSSRASRGVQNLIERLRSVRAKAVRRDCAFRLLMRCLTIESEGRETWTAASLRGEFRLTGERYADGHVFKHTIFWRRETSGCVLGTRREIVTSQRSKSHTT